MTHKTPLTRYDGIAWALFVALLIIAIFVAPLAFAQPAPLYTITGDTTIRWVPPTENVDGTPLTDLAGYRVYWGEDAGGPYPNQMDISDGSLTSSPVTFTLDHAGQVTWYFVMTAIDTDGNESAYSNEVAKTITVTITDNRPPAPPTQLEVDMNFSCIGSMSEIICTIEVTP